LSGTSFEIFFPLTFILITATIPSK
jgi:hypothetical protein